MTTFQLFIVITFPILVNAIFTAILFWALNSQISYRFEAINQRFEAIDRRFEALEKLIDARFESLEREFRKEGS